MPALLAAFASLLALIALGSGVALGAAHDLGYSRSVTPGLAARYAALFRHGDRAALGKWQKFVRAVPQERRGPGEVALLAAVNSFFNDVPYASDAEQWGVDDYWASPAEMLASDGADCEDFSIAKYFTLKELGVPLERLRITYVKAVQLDQAHMVLAYYPTPEAEPLILDNLDDRVRPASERPDLVPVYSFNDDEVLLARQNRPAGSPMQIRMWRSLVAKLETELCY